MLTRRMLLPLLAAGTAGCSQGNNGHLASPLAYDSSTGGAAGSPAVAQGAVASDAPPATLVVVFQRFAADWINMLVPAGDSAYAGLRPTLRVDSPLALDGFYGLNPALTDLEYLYSSGDLAFVAATGWIPTDSRDRSHFYAQSLAEAGARTGVSSGWLGRFLNGDTAYNADLWAALSAESAVPSSLQGFPNAIAIRDFAAYTHGSVMGDSATALLESLAEQSGDPGSTVLRLARSMRSVALAPPPVSSVIYPNSNLGQGLKVAAQAIHGGLAPRVITVTSDDDWDTHVNQANRHANSLPKFAGALRAFHEDLGPLMDRVTVVTMTEFGRKAVENLGGTDHGTGSSMLVMGRGVAGGQVYGQWPGLHASALYQGEDLEPTTDYRSVLGELLVRRMGVAESALDAIFPGGFAGSAHWRHFCP
jgi:uncharacterized protein (DUF1501 family)